MSDTACCPAVSTRYSYNEIGNLLSRNGPGLEQRFSYNALNQLVHAEITEPQGVTTVDYAYDHDGIRVSKTIDGRDEVKYLVDANRPYAQVIEEAWTRGGLSAVTDYVYGHGLVSQSIDGNHRFYHYDGFHNTRSLTDMDGAVTDTYHYDAYGTLQEQNGSTSNPYLYRGEQFDAETDSYYLRARYYQPGTGRFLSTDPFEGETSDPMTLHHYLYGNNDPVNNIDPSGEISVNEMLIVSGEIGALSAMGWYYGDIFQEQYAKIADWFPDAGIVGQNFFLKWRLKNPQFFWWTKNIPTSLKLPLDFFDSSYNFVTDTWWREKFNAGIIFGVEGMWSFGSSQRGFFWYLGLQQESGFAQGLNMNKKRPSLDTSLYTGYVFNLWNCDDYLGAFAALNTPIGSYFFDPEDFVENKGPWGPSWSIWSKSFGSTTSNSFMAGAGGTWYFRRPFGEPSKVPYGQLAIEWTALQIGMFAYSALNNDYSAIATGVGAASTGLIARSKQIYNKKHGYHERRQMNEDNRLKEWRSGPGQPYSKLLGLFL